MVYGMERGSVRYMTGRGKGVDQKRRETTPFYAMAELEHHKATALDHRQLCLQAEPVELDVFKEGLARVQDPEAKKDTNKSITQSKAIAQSKKKMPTWVLAAGQS